MCRNGRTRGDYLHFYSGSTDTVVIIGCKSWLKHDYHRNAISKTLILMEKSAVKVVRRGLDRDDTGVILKEDVGSGKIDVSRDQ